MNHPIDLGPESCRRANPQAHPRADPETNTDLKTQNSGAFNQARSKQGRLTYSRLGGILSAMGFTTAKTPNGCSAILWDDQLLLW